jgi:hypothetical protein
MMKNILLFSFFLLTSSPQLSAQTLKNIYRHNLPVLRIPSALIDKVETAEI